MRRKGTGYATVFYGTGYGNGFPDESRATIELSENGIVTVYVEVSDVGSGGYSIMKQIAEETLNIENDCLILKNTNTSYMKDSGTAAASRQTYNTGNAVLNGCKNLLDNISKVFQLSNSKVLNKDSLKKIYNELIKNNIEAIADGYFKATTSQVDLETGQGDPYWPYSFGLQKAIVEVDDETGKVDIIELVAINDAGKIVNPVLAEGQAIGGCSMGIGYALMEEIELSEGKIKNTNFSDYIIPTSKDMPKVKSIFVEEEERSGPYGAKGLGETVMLATAPAIINAIYDAINVRIYDLPATPDKVLLEINKNR
ncbi:xanthine dehydrogenase family protein molybdopterin-binding subunit [Clostridium sp. NSJ-6]|uniref:Xanthine dehydrogenase family protein molybdopterin-binding subunit n=1 Tax=Clostridium hominis TaxID=2763036 RepID=A0ABR7DD21_9CLOT|nr:xanthine dehydrogenase family protein molybdopterin-binding subunit [Clostridium hominis]MDU2670545.1 molybdopterin-dependent oxidoreductase [Clostridium sp.]